MSKNQVKKALEEISHYLRVTKGCGHTTLLLDGVDNSDRPSIMITICSRRTPGKSMNVSLQSLHRLRGHKKPLVIDNGALLVLLEESLATIENLEFDVIAATL